MAYKKKCKVFIQGSKSPESRVSQMSLGVHRKAGEVFGLSQARIPKMGVGGCIKLRSQGAQTSQLTPKCALHFPHWEVSV